MSLRRFLRLLLDKNWQPSVPKADDSLARTTKDTLHSTSTKGTRGFSSTGAVYERIAEGHENYAKSFKKEG